MELFTAFYSQIPASMEHFENLYTGSPGQPAPLLFWGRTSLVLMAVALILLLFPATRKNDRWLAAACGVTFISLWIDKGICLVVSGFMSSPLGGTTPYVPTLPEVLISLAIWAVGALMITVFYKITLAVREGAETWIEERLTNPLPTVE
jgi:molybdopterin-containing oxidoreductase family membrane subunit